MAEERPEDFERGFLAHIGDAVGGWWKKQSPAERRKSVGQIFLCLFIVIVVGLGVGQWRKHVSNVRQASERQNLPGVAGAPGAPSSAESARGALPGGAPAAPGGAGTAAAAAAAAPANGGKASSPAAATTGKPDGRSSLPGVK